MIMIYVGSAERNGVTNGQEMEDTNCFKTIQKLKEDICNSRMSVLGHWQANFYYPAIHDSKLIGNMFPFSFSIPYPNKGISLTF